MSSQALVKIDEGRRALAEAKDLFEVKDIRDKAAVVQDYLKCAGYCLEAQNYAADLKLSAERRLGELLAETVNHKGGGDRKSRSHHATVIGDLPDGVNKSQSQRWQKMATVPQAEYRAFVDRTTTKGQSLTSAGLLRLASDLASIKGEVTDKEPVGDEKPFDPLAEQERVYQWLSNRRGGWPDRWQVGFPDMLRRVADRLERENVNRGHGADTAAGDNGEDNAA